MEMTDATVPPEIAQFAVKEGQAKVYLKSWTLMMVPRLR
jgi:hypothetical protein